MSSLESEISAALEKTLDGAPVNLAEAMRYSLLAPGKRIRPRLALASGKLVQAPSSAALSAAIAIEMIHCFTLIHDDLPCMDNSDLRRGRPSCHKKFGEALALLAGDALIASALETLQEAAAHVAPPRFARASVRLHAALGPRGVIGGQAAESLLHAKSPAIEVRAMHAAKTGALFSASVLMPADLAGLDSTSSRGAALDAFSTELGAAFQALDDLEDGESDDPKSLLFHLPAAEIRSTALNGLRAKRDALEAAWGGGASELSAIADEVLKKLEALPS